MFYCFPLLRTNSEAVIGFAECEKLVVPNSLETESLGSQRKTIERPGSRHFMHEQCEYPSVVILVPTFDITVRRLCGRAFCTMVCTMVPVLQQPIL